MAAGRRRSSGLLIILLAILIIVGLGAAYFMFRNQLTPQQPAATDPAALDMQQAMVNIVITTQYIPRGTQLTAEVLTTVPYPQKDLVEGTFFTDITAVIGKQAKYDLDARLPLTSSLIADTQVGSYAAFQIPKGMVAISIPISHLSAISYAPQEGDHVNIIVSLSLVDVDPAFQTRLPNYTASVIAPGPGDEDSPATRSATIISGGEGSTQGRVELDGTLNEALYVVPSEDQRPRTVSQTLVQNAIVLHLGNYLDDKQEDDNNLAVAEPTPVPETTGEEGEATTEDPQEITLVVSPQDAVTLNYLMQVGGKLSLVLRSAGDNEQIKTEAVTLQFLMDQYAIPSPAKLPYALENNALPSEDAIMQNTQP
jgi:pilus assembly protein CpaB